MGLKGEKLKPSKIVQRAIGRKLKHARLTLVRLSWSPNFLVVVDSSQALSPRTPEKAQTPSSGEPQDPSKVAIWVRFVLSSIARLVHVQPISFEVGGLNVGLL
jgi:hypothetical protein